MTALTATIPADLNELARHWTKFILTELRRRGRVKFNAEDVLAHVMLKLCESNVVSKFHAGTREQSHPLTVSAVETAGMLGISLGDFLAFQVESEDSLAPVSFSGKPVEDGMGYTSPKARYMFCDVIALSASVAFPNQGVQVLPAHKEPTVSQWKAYLSQAVGNHSANYTRSYQRHESREHAPDHFAQFRSEEGMIFEDRLVDESAEATIEQAFNVAALLKRAPGLQTRKTTDDKCFFDLLRDGYTLREASKAVGLNKHELKVLTAHVGE